MRRGPLALAGVGLILGVSLAASPCAACSIQRRAPIAQCLVPTARAGVPASQTLTRKVALPRAQTTLPRPGSLANTAARATTKSVCPAPAPLAPKPQVVTPTPTPAPKPQVVTPTPVPSTPGPAPGPSTGPGATPTPAPPPLSSNAPGATTVPGWLDDQVKEAIKEVTALPPTPGPQTVPGLVSPTPSPTPIPEPAPFALLAVAMSGWAWRRRMARRRA